MDLEALKKAKFKVYDSTVYFKVEHYQQNNRIALQLMTNDKGYEEPSCTLTVNIPEAELCDDEVLIKNWSENERSAKAAFETGLFEDTGKNYPSGYVSAPVWRIK